MPSPSRGWSDPFHLLLKSRSGGRRRYTSSPKNLSIGEKNGEKKAAEGGEKKVAAAEGGGKKDEGDITGFRNPEGDLPTHIETWGSSQVKKEFVCLRSIHGSVHTDGWFEGISWDSDENLIAYVAEEPEPAKPTFTPFGYKKEGTTNKDCGSWKGQGDLEAHWGETYVGKRQPTLFVIEINRWWGHFEESWGIVQNYPKALPFYSNFDQVLFIARTKK